MASALVFVTFTLNGRPQEMHVRPDEMLVDVLRDRFALTGTKVGCDVAACGACTVLVEGAPVAACATFAWQIDGRKVRTIEGLAGGDGALDPVQQAFVERSAFQCGYCTSGMIMLARALLDHDSDPDRETIRRWMGANVCRCTGYEMILEAVERAALRQRERDQ